MFYLPYVGTYNDTSRLKTQFTINLQFGLKFFVFKLFIMADATARQLQFNYGSVKLKYIH